MKIKSAYTMLELAMAMVVASLVLFTVIKGNSLLASARLAKISSITKTAPMSSMRELVLWLETTNKESFPIEFKDGDVVTNWLDLNPQIVKKHIATANGTPTYREKAINGLPAIEFDSSGTTSFSIVNSNELNLKGSFTAFAVLSTKDVGSGLNQAIFSRDVNNAYDWRISPNFNNRVVLTDTSGNQTRTSSNVVPLDKAFIMSVVVDIGNNVTLEENKVHTYTQGTNRKSLVSNNGNFVIGSNNGDQSLEFDGLMGEIIVFNRKLSRNERDEIYKYLSEKWGIVLE